MWIKDRLAQWTTPKSIKAYTTPESERMVTKTLSERYRRLIPSVRAAEWAGVGVVHLTASYLRRSVMRPGAKKRIMQEALMNKLEILWGGGDFDHSLSVLDELKTFGLKNSQQVIEKRRQMMHDSLVTQAEFFWQSGDVEGVVEATRRMGVLNVKGRKPIFV